jgi:hypothetical protein
MSSAVQKTKAIYPWPVLLAIVAVTALSLWGALDFYRSVTLFYRSHGDPYGLLLQETRFRQVDRMLPPGITVGYVSDVPVSNVRGNAAFNGAQYVLAPRLVVELAAGHKPEWVLGNFSKVGNYQTIAQVLQLTIVKDFGSGIVVFRRRTD